MKEFQEVNQEIDPEVLQKRKNMWKAFGRETQAGKMLFDLYKSHQPPKINYPKPKQKTKEQLELEKQKKLKPPPPQTMKISYPQPKVLQPTKIAMVDLIPKKKNVDAIKEEMQKYNKQYQLPASRPIDRQKQKRQLQNKFKNSNGTLPIQTQIPKVQLTQQQQQRIQKKIIDKYLQKKGIVQKQKQTKTKTKKEQLNQLFDQIVAQIQERQAFLQKIAHTQQNELKQRIKRQMIDRVSELQTITQMRSKC